MVGAQTDSDKPFYFLHIAKTGGTSLSEAIGRLYPADRRFSDDGNVTVDYLKGLEPKLSSGCFISGHAGPGVARHLAGRANLITLLRRPDHQAVSNYLHVLTEPQNALHESAMRQSFSDYLRENPQQIAYQATSLAVALSTDENRVDPLSRNEVDRLLDFLESMAFVGVIERPDACCEQLSALMSLERPLRLPCLNSAVYRGVPARSLERLHREYRSLMHDPQLAFLFALEALVYAKAEALLTRGAESGAGVLRASGRRGSDRRESDRPGTPAVTAATRFSSHQGSLDGGRFVCALADPPGHLIFGPFDRLGRGCYTVAFLFSLEGAAPGAAGQIEIEVLANGADSLARRWLPARSPMTAKRRTLALYCRNDADILEFRVRAKGFGAGSLIFEGVSIRPVTLWQTWPSALGGHVRRAVGYLRRAEAKTSVNLPAPVFRNWTPAGPNSLERIMPDAAASGRAARQTR